MSKKWFGGLAKAFAGGKDSSGTNTRRYLSSHPAVEVEDQDVGENSDTSPNNHPPHDNYNTNTDSNNNYNYNNYNTNTNDYYNDANTDSNNNDNTNDNTTNNYNYKTTSHRPSDDHDVSDDEGVELPKGATYTVSQEEKKYGRNSKFGVGQSSNSMKAKNSKSKRSPKFSRRKSSSSSDED